MRSVAIVENTARNIGIYSLEPLWEIWPKVEERESLLQVIPLTGVESSVPEIDKNRDDRRIFFVQIEHQILDKSNIFSNVSPFHLTGLVGVYYFW